MGVGLGLEISQNLAKLMAPNLMEGIQVRSEYGKGSAFFFNLEACGQNMEDSSDIKFLMQTSERKEPILLTDFESICMKKDSIRHKRVLIADDDQVNLFVMRSHFNELSSFVELHTACDGLCALKIIQELSQTGDFFDLILMDCNMPIMNGFECISSFNQMVLQGLHPQAKVFAITGLDTQAQDKTISDLGMEKLLKPLTKSTFRKVVIPYLVL